MNPRCSVLVQFPMRVLLLLALFGGIDDLVRNLGSDDIDVRDSATKSLRDIGEPARSALERAAGSDDAEVASRATDLLRPLLRLRVECPSSVGLGEAIRVVARLSCGSLEEEVYFREGLEVRVILVETHEVPPQDGNRYGGRFQSRWSTGCNLKDDDFVQLRPGEQHELVIDDLRDHRNFGIADDVKAVYPLISVSSPTICGRYRVVATYSYDRRSYVGLCNKRCRDHDLASRLWNGCFDKSLRAEAEFVLR